jgi:hypothetical protein
LAKDSFDGIYAAYLTGAALPGFGLLLFQDGVLTGVDAGGATYDGAYNFTDDGHVLEVKAKVVIPPGVISVQGPTAGPTGLPFDVAVKLQMPLSQDSITRIETPLGPVDLLNEVDHPGPFRLVGMVAYDLVGIDDLVQLDLFSTRVRQRQLEVAIDKLVKRFGPNVVHRANDLTKPPGVPMAPTLDFLDELRVLAQHLLNRSDAGRQTEALE